MERKNNKRRKQEKLVSRCDYLVLVKSDLDNGEGEILSMQLCNLGGVNQLNTNADAGSAIYPGVNEVPHRESPCSKPHS